MELFVYHTPHAAPAGRWPACAAVIDVLRATSTVAAALRAGAEAVEVCESVDELLSRGAGLPVGKRVLAGERGGVRLPECDLGNSPLEFTDERVGGRRVLLSTTNGTRALRRMQGAPLVLSAALVSRRATAGFLLKAGPAEVWLVGSGWQGQYAAEDDVCGGAIARALLDAGGKGVKLGNDEALAAVSLFDQWRPRLPELLRAASHGRRLRKLGCDADLDWCAKLDALDVVAVQRAPGVLERAS